MKSIFIPRYFWNGTNDEVCTNTAVLVRDNRNRSMSLRNCDLAIRKHRFWKAMIG